MQFNVVPRTGGLAINKEKLRKKEGCDGIILTTLGQDTGLWVIWKGEESSR